MAHAKVGEALALLRAQIRAVKTNMRDPSRRIEAILDGDAFRNLAADMAAETRLEFWRAVNTSPNAAVAERVVTGHQIDGAHIILSNQVNGMRVEATKWPTSTFGT